MMDASIRITTPAAPGMADPLSGGSAQSAPAKVGLEGYAYTDQLGRLSGAAALPSIALRGLRLHAVTEVQAVQHVLGQLEAGKGGWVVTPNLDHLRRLSRDRVFRALYSHANLVVADGMPLIWASRLQGTPLPERVAGSSLISSLTAAAAEARRSVFFLGGDPGTADQAAAILLNRNPNLIVAGTYCPGHGFEKDENQLRGLIEHLVAAKPDIVFVALGSPKQEWLIAQLRGYLPKAWWLGIGIGFSFLSGRVRRAPGWMQRIGLEWLHRLCQEPKRLGRRYLLEGIPFATALLAGSLAQGMGRHEHSDEHSLAAEADRGA